MPNQEVVVKPKRKSRRQRQIESMTDADRRERIVSILADALVQAGIASPPTSVSGKEVQHG